MPTPGARGPRKACAGLLAVRWTCVVFSSLLATHPQCGVTIGVLYALVKGDEVGPTLEQKVFTIQRNSSQSLLA